VPDNPALCSAYLGAIVDRSPVLVAISTAGAAPVLGQRIRARIESMLPADFGRVASYLNRHRASLRTLSSARRRTIQHHLIEGRAADHIIAGDDSAADRLLARLMTTADEDSAALVKIVDIGGGDPGCLSLHGVETIRNADIIVHQADVAPAITDLTRREALGFTGHLVAQGHVIPDQADYLRRCGFTHVEIDRQAARQWRRSLALAPPAMQRILGSQRGRATDPARSAAPPRRPDRNKDR
jgi:uroporphyrin-III C-methyltransferase/precorrin-2 dehydrogenase/sirohydrochlorin ferrochelatase